MGATQWCPSLTAQSAAPMQTQASACVSYAAFDNANKPSLTVPPYRSDRGPDTSLPVLVTASVDAIELLARLTLDKDLSVSGQVVWTGRSSLDIKMQMSQVTFSLWDVMMSVC